MVLLDFNWVLIGLLAKSTIATPTFSNTNRTGLAPYTYQSNSSELVPNSYIVKLKDGHTLQAHFQFIGANISFTGHDYSKLDILPGYSIDTNKSVIDNLVRRDPGVEWVEHNSYIYPEHLPPSNAEDIRNVSSPQPRKTKRWSMAEQVQAPLKLAMQSRAHKIRLNNLPTSFYYWDDAGKNTDIYIMSTGIHVDHPDFGGRAYNFGNRRVSPYLTGRDRIMEDTSAVNYGTCIASLAAGTTFGIAKRANIINVKVLGEGASTETLVKAFNDIRKAHNAKKSRRAFFRRSFAGSVINFSVSRLGRRGPPSPSLLEAVQKAKQAGILVVSGAGDYNRDTRASFPCNMGVVCVAAVDIEYRKANFSNYGQAITVSAPGTDVPCAAGNGFRRYSGTFLASGYVTGTLATFISYEKIRSDSELIMRRMRQNWNVGFLEGFPENYPTANTFNSNGVLKPNKMPTQPYIGAPRRFNEVAV